MAAILITDVTIKSTFVASHKVFILETPATADAADTTNDPKLLVSHSVPPVRKTINTIAEASMKTWNTIANANIKTSNTAT